jgi:hypothetical protein
MHTRVACSCAHILARRCSVHSASQSPDWLKKIVEINQRNAL